MVPDKVPRKAMGGGFRSTSPPRHSLQATGKGVLSSVRNSDDSHATPRPGSGGGPGARRAAPSSRDKLILLQQEEAAQIEKEYIKNLQQQVYYLELELNYTKARPAGLAQPGAVDEGSTEHSLPAQVEGLPSTPQRPATASSVGGSALKAAPGGYEEEEVGPYAAVNMVRQAAERACEELKRARVQQMEEAASRAYDITASHLVDHVARVEAEAQRLSAVVSAVEQRLDEERAAHRSALVKAEAASQGLRQQLEEKTEEMALTYKARNEYMQKSIDATEALQLAETDLSRVRQETTKLQAKCAAAEDSVRLLTLRAEDAEAQLHANEGSLTAAEEVELQERAKTAQLEVATAVAARAALEREVEGLRAELAAQQAAAVTAGMERDHAHSLLEQEKAKRASQDARAQLAAEKVRREHAESDVAALRAQLGERDAAVQALRQEMDDMRTRVEQNKEDMKVNAELRARAEQRRTDADAALTAITAEKAELTAQVAALKANEEAAARRRGALERALEEARRDASCSRLQASLVSADSSLTE